MIRVYNPVTKLYEAQANKDYSKPQPVRKKAPIVDVQPLQAQVKIMEAKLTAIAKCTNVKQVKAILS